ncbi:MAG: SRPBCC family protein [Mucilaginibacter sp.]|uniref:SRPBCC family protein n=1 Tax=Mucilaginibacter sp. TaxID=1882438 RepID=UPI003265E63E
MTTEKKLKLTAEPGKQELFIVREFEAPRDMVFKAYTDPDLLIKWLGPNGYTMAIDYYEPKNGGAYRYIHTDPKGNEYCFHGVIHTMQAPEMLIQTFEFEGMPTKGHVSLDTAIFEELPNGRTKLTIQSVYKSVADRDGMISSGMEYGLTEGFAKLDEILAS